MLNNSELNKLDGITKKYVDYSIAGLTFSGGGGGTGTSGTSGTSGINGLTGTSGTSGINGLTGTSGTSGFSGTSGTSGTRGTSGTSGINGLTGTSGTSGLTGTSGTSGFNGTSGTSGTGTSGTSGINGTSGTSGINGLVGTSGTSGINGLAGTSGTSGFNGTSGTSGIGTSGTSGLTGTSGTSGLTGTSGTSGATITLSSNVNNYLVAMTGVANTLQGESNATFDGNTLLLDKNGSVPNITLQSSITTSASPFIKLTPPAAGTDYSLGVSVSGGNFQIGYGTLPTTNTRFTINSTGQIAVGSITPTTKLHVDGQIAGRHTVLANGTLAMDLANNTSVKVTPTATGSFTTTVPPAGTRATVIILTSGTTSFTITFGTGFKPIGTLATGTVASRIWITNWISDGTNLYQTSVAIGPIVA